MVRVYTYFEEGSITKTRLTDYSVLEWQKLLLRDVEAVMLGGLRENFQRWLEENKICYEFRIDQQKNGTRILLRTYINFFAEGDALHFKLIWG